MIGGRTVYKGLNQLFDFLVGGQTAQLFMDRGVQFHRCTLAPHDNVDLHSAANVWATALFRKVIRLAFMRGCRVGR